MRRVLEQQSARTVLEPAGILLEDIVKLHRWGVTHLPKPAQDSTERSFRCAGAMPACDGSHAGSAQRAPGSCSPCGRQMAVQQTPGPPVPNCILALYVFSFAHSWTLTRQPCDVQHPYSGASPAGIRPYHMPSHPTVRPSACA